MERRDAESKARSRFPDGFRIMQGRQEYVTYLDRSSLRIWYSEEPYYYDKHCHSAVEIIMPIRGEVTYTIQEHACSVQADEVLIVPGGCIHDLDMREGSARYLLLFEPDAIFGMRDMQMIDQLLKMPIYITGQPELQASIRALIQQTVDCYERKPLLWNSLCYSYLLQMYVRLGQYYLEQGLSAPPENRKKDPEIIDSARLYIDQNYSASITLDDLAAFTGFSKYYFSRIFKQQFGVSYSDYLRKRRINVAEEMLIHSGQPIQDIAVAAGFGSIATFNRVFKEARNCTPTQYREIYSDIS